jgi:hypothetical protein
MDASASVLIPVSRCVWLHSYWLRSPNYLTTLHQLLKLFNFGLDKVPGRPVIVTAEEMLIYQWFM